MQYSASGAHFLHYRKIITKNFGENEERHLTNRCDCFERNEALPVIRL